ncbi:AraC-like DNA-binding protein [Neobacillus niacini]|uniref:AraC family transcriptional regulator n=1 Tax=Neobacillus niacini TaxID=86668 RepID=UPI002866BAEC|nr:AraC family transcriptional regulator [Neobacillus niacini]MDR7078741.1 AraC-like DNA-binding protein [Neobacillus niacini]
MKILNYLKLNQHPIQLRLEQNRTDTFTEVYHAHQGMELLYIHKGNGKAVIDQQIFPINEGTLVIIKPYQLHHIQFLTSPSQPYIRSLFVFEPAILEGFLSPFPSLYELLQGLCYDKNMIPVLNNEKLSEIETFIKLYKSKTEEKSPSELLEQQALFMIAVLTIIKPIWKESVKVIDRSSIQPSTVEQIMRWIDENYMEPFELNALAKSIHLSPVHVSSLFRKHVGSSITDYLTARRIREASWLLKTTNLSVKEIGESVGLTNFSYFCQLFKKNVGISPHQYRKMVLFPNV